ncbi:MAG: PaaX family transcriptional regulator C-terminal domain-containing protein [bacterium]
MLKHQALIYYLFTEYAYTFEEREIAVQDMIYLLAPFGFSSQAVRVLLSRFKSKGMVETRRQGKKSYYGLTNAGIEVLARAGKQLFSRPVLQWNGYWRIITYNIPETERKKRDEFRNFLLYYRFGSLSNGVWICPDGKGGVSLAQLKEKINQLDINQYVYIFQAEKIGSQSNESLIFKAYGLEDLIKEYNSFIAKYQKEINSFQEPESEEEILQQYVKRFEVAYEHSCLLQKDPCLPQDLIPAYWNGSQADSIAYTYVSLLGKAVSVYFKKDFPKRTREDVLNIFNRAARFLEN